MAVWDQIMLNFRNCWPKFRYRFMTPNFEKTEFQYELDELSQKNLDLYREAGALRGQWKNRLDFMMSCIGYAVGLGNVWRFPIRCYESGGGAFLLVYSILCLILGVPLLFIELGLGQFSGRSPMMAFKLVPVFYGVGWSMIVISIIIEIYYAVVISWAFLFLFGSFAFIMPWTVCNHTFNSINCISSITKKSEMNNSRTYVSSTSEYWDYYVTGFYKWPSREPYVLNENPGSPLWHLSLCLLLTWIVIGLSLMLGIQISGKIMYLIVIFPYFALISLIILGSTLPGAMDGIRMYLLPDWSVTMKPKNLLGATEQLFFSTSIAMGGMLTYASFNNFRDNIYRDTFIIIFVDFLTSFLSGFAVFSILGYMSHRSGIPVSKVIASGEGLFFITCTEALATVSGSNFWTFLLMLMAVFLGLSSQFAPMETLSTGLSDKYRFLRSTRMRKAVFIWVIVAFHFLCGLLMCTPGGKFWLLILDSRLSAFGIPIVALLELIILGMIYGFKQLRYDFRMMMGFSMDAIWMYLIIFICPFIIFSILIFSVIRFSVLEVNGVPIPIWGEIVAMFILFLVILPIITGFIHTVVRYRRKYPDLHGKQFLVKLISPPIYWGPRDLRNWLIGNFYREKMIRYQDDPLFLKYRSPYEDVSVIVDLVENDIYL